MTVESINILSTVIVGFHVCILLMTLSKILCKWKQDSAVSLFLYLNSVFKNKHKLVHNQASVMNSCVHFFSISITER